MPTRKPTPPIYQLKITLNGIEPPIWRRIHVPSTIHLCCLHPTLQLVMGWTDSHLHQFDKDGKHWGILQLHDDEDLDVADDAGVPLDGVLKAAGDTLVYVYDFGDDWRHSVVLEELVPSAAKLSNPICLVGERHCPPEDVGGPHGYQEFLRVIFDPTHEEFKHMVSWAGGPFQAEEFNVMKVNDILLRMRLPVRHRRKPE